jgi:hypothetical protein
MPKNEADIQFITSLRFTKWDAGTRSWNIPNYPGNTEKIKAHFAGRITRWEEAFADTNDSGRSARKAEVLAIKTLSGRTKLIFGFQKGLTYLIKQLPYHSWNSKNKWWTIPYSEKFLEMIQNQCKEDGLTFTLEEEQDETGRTARISPFDIPNYRTCPDEFINKLKELRYSESTIKTYTNSFEEFINYFHKQEIDNINETMVIRYLRFLVSDRKVSISYQNQAINAIKFYYERVLGGQRKLYFIERPIKERALPIMLNHAELISILKVTTNIKHKAMLMLTYSAGLRVSELLNLKVKDIDSERLQVRVMQAKERKTGILY